MGIWTPFTIAMLRTLQSMWEIFDCFPCGLWLARLHIFILTASVVGYITPAARLSKVLVGIRFAAFNLYCLLLSRCYVPIYLSEKPSGCTANFKPSILLSFPANIFIPMQPNLVATSSCQILVFWQQLMFAACIHKLLVAVVFFRVFLVAMLRYTFSLMISHLLFLLFLVSTLWKIFVSWGYYSEYWKNRKCSKPPTSFCCFYDFPSFWWFQNHVVVRIPRISKLVEFLVEQPSLPKRFSWGSNTWMITPKIEYSSSNNNNNDNDNNNNWYRV